MKKVVVGSVWLGGGRRRGLHGELGGGGNHGGSGSSVPARASGERAGEHQWEEGELPGGAVAAAEGRRGNLHVAGPAAMAPAVR